MDTRPARLAVLNAELVSPANPNTPSSPLGVSTEGKTRAGSSIGSGATLERLERQYGGVVEPDPLELPVERPNIDRSRFISKSGKNAGSSGRLSCCSLYTGE